MKATWDPDAVSDSGSYLATGEALPDVGQPTGAKRRCSSAALEGLVSSLAVSSVTPAHPRPASPGRERPGFRLRRSMHCALLHLRPTFLCTPLYGVFPRPKGQSTQGLYEQRVAGAAILRRRV